VSDLDALKMEVDRLKKGLDRARAYIETLEKAIEELTSGQRQTAEIVRLEAPDRRDPVRGSQSSEKARPREESEDAILSFPVRRPTEPPRKG